MRARGFTLVEMLVAMAVFSLLALAASSLLGVSLRNADVFARADTATRELQLARSIMRSDFSQIALRPVRDAFGSPIPASFSGGSRGVSGLAASGQASEQTLLSFVRRGWENPGGADGRSSLQYVEYAIAGGALVRRSRPYLDPTPETPVATRHLLSGVNAGAVQFLFNGVWSDRWTTMPPRNSLPDAIALDVTSVGSGTIRQAFLVGDP